MIIDTKRIVPFKPGNKLFVAAPSKNIYEVHEFMKDKINYEPFLLATGDNHVVIQGHVYKYCGEYSDYIFGNNMMI